METSDSCMEISASRGEVVDSSDRHSPFYFLDASDASSDQSLVDNSAATVRSNPTSPLSTPAQPGATTPIPSDNEDDDNDQPANTSSSPAHSSVIVDVESQDDSLWNRPSSSHDAEVTSSSLSFNSPNRNPCSSPAPTHNVLPASLSSAFAEQPLGSTITEVSFERHAGMDSLAPSTYDVECSSERTQPAYSSGDSCLISGNHATPVTTFDDLQFPKLAGSSITEAPARSANTSTSSPRLSPKSDQTQSVAVGSDQTETIAGCSGTATVSGYDHSPSGSTLSSKVEQVELEAKVDPAASTTTMTVATAVPKMESSVASDSQRSEVVSPEPNCAICLGQMHNKSFTNSCFHQFCFTCLLEWSKVKAECPLCKQPFKSIVHNVRSMEDYDQYHLRTEEFNAWDNPDGRRFRYRSTLTSERRREATLGRLLNTLHHGGGGSRSSSGAAASSAFVPVRHLYSTSDFRRYIYERGLWVQSSARTTRSMTRFREATPEFYSANPACTHRLLPWLNRELNALNYGHQTAFLLELITSLVLRFHIQSPEFGEHLRPYFLNNTEHFVHEFHNFARSPCDMGDYDRTATYPSVTSPANSSGNDEDDGGDADVVFLSQRRDPLARPSARALRLETSAVAAALRSSTQVLNRARDFLTTLHLQRATRSMASASSATGEPGMSRSPQPGPSGVMSRLSGPALGLANLDNVIGSSSSDDDSTDQGSSLLRSIINARSLSRLRAQQQQLERKPLITVNVEDEENEEDDCLIVDVVGKARRSPVAVIMLSDTDDEVQVDDDHHAATTSTTSTNANTTTTSTPSPSSPSNTAQPSTSQPLPRLTIKLSLTKARQASMAAGRSARRMRLSSSSSSSARSSDNIRSPSPDPTLADGSISSSGSVNLEPRPDCSTYPNESSSSECSSRERDDAPPTVKSKVIRLRSTARGVPASTTDHASVNGESSWTASSTLFDRVTVRMPRHLSGEEAGGSSSSSRSRSRSQQSHHSSSGSRPPKKASSSSKKKHSAGKRRRRDLNDEVEQADDSASKSSSPRKKSKKHKHHKSIDGKHKHSRRGKVSKKEVTMEEA